MGTDKKLKKIAKKMKLHELPIAAYVVTKEGRLIDYNKRFQEILNLSADEISTCNITDFYHNPKERERLIEKLNESEQHEDRYLEKEIIYLKTKSGKNIFVEDNCRTIRDKRSRETIGFMGFLADATEEVQFRRLFDQLPTGIYQLDKEGKIVKANQVVVKMLGYDSEDDLIGKSVRGLYNNPDEENLIQESIVEKGFVKNTKVELIKKTNETIFVSVNAFKLEDSNGNYIGREGTITDVTTEERYHRILEDVPVGFYMVRIENGKEIIRHCNKQFAEIFEYENSEKVIGCDIKTLYLTPEDHPKFILEIKKKDGQNLPIIGYALKVKTNKGKNIFIEVNSRLLHDKNGNIIGRTGVIREITEEIALRNQVKEFTDDIGRVLHAYTSTLLMIAHSIIPVLQFLGPDPFEHERVLDLEHEDKAWEQPRKNLISSMEKLIKFKDSKERSDALSDDDWSELLRLYQILIDIEKNGELAVRTSILRETIYQISVICNRIIKGKLHREVVRQAERDIDSVLKICSLIALHQASDVILMMDSQVRSLREYVTFGARIKEPRVVCKIGNLIHRAIVNVEGYSTSLRVDIRYKIANRDVKVDVIERDVIRALTNLFHNAIKYSWVRKDNNLSWIVISDKIEGNQIHIEVENRGVPIPKEEIERDLIFQIGYRGRLSSGRGRMGTGVGLTDAKRVAKEHGGDVVLDSHPATFGGKVDDYSQPFLTKASLILPIYSK